jgi:hypothetical protein
MSASSWTVSGIVCAGRRDKPWIAGRVDMAPCDVLDAADLDDGLILACQARAAGADVHVEF